MKLAVILEFLNLPTFELPSDVLEMELRGLAMDSRIINEGDVFIAVPGKETDGRDFILQALNRGASVVFEQASVVQLHRLHGRLIFGVPELRVRIPELADFFYDSPSKKLKIIGVTGTNGKTSTSHFVAQIFGQVGQSCGVLGTVGNGLLHQLSDARLTTSDCCEINSQLANCFQHGANYVAMEVSSHALDQQRLQGTVIDTAVFTNLTQDHLDYHSDMDTYFAAKARLFTAEHAPRFAVLNMDDPNYERLLAKVHKDCKIYTYSTHNEFADIYLANETLHTPWGNGEFKCSLLGKFNLSNVLASVTVCGIYGIEIENLLLAINNLRPVVGRMQVVEIEQPAPKVVIDYAHTPDALAKVLSALREPLLNSNAKLHCVFGCGGDRDRTKRPLMLHTALQYSDSVIITQDNPRTEDPQTIVNDMLDGIEQSEKISIELDRAQAIKRAINNAAVHDLVLIAGKGHEEYQIIGTEKLPFSDYVVAKQVLNVKIITS